MTTFGKELIQSAKEALAISEGRSSGSVWDAIKDTPAEAENMKLRSAFVMALDKKIRANGWTPQEAAAQLGVTQSRVSALINGKFNEFDAADWLTSDEAISAFIADAEATGDKAYIEQAQHVAERARALNKKKDEGLPHERRIRPAEHVL